MSDWSFSLDFKNFDHFHLGFVRSGLILSKSSVSYMNYYRYFSQIPWFWSKWTHFLCKKVCRFIIFHGSRVRDPPKMMDFDHLDTLFVKKSVSFWLFRSISQANYRSDYESSVLYIKQRWFWRIFSSEYQVLYMNYVGFWGADFTQPGIFVHGGHMAPVGGPDSRIGRNLDIPIGFHRFWDMPRPPLSPLETSSSV